jgi:hypothetical protein
VPSGYRVNKSLHLHGGSSNSGVTGVNNSSGINYNTTQYNNTN